MRRFRCGDEKRCATAFFAPVKEFAHAFFARLTQIDYGRAMAFNALDDSSCHMLGVVRLHANADNETAEYAILVRSDLKAQGLGLVLMQMIIESAPRRRCSSHRRPSPAREQHDACDVQGTGVRHHR
jgi:acetyltransferase